jgi:hypothetical protein
VVGSRSNPSPHSKKPTTRGFSFDNRSFGKRDSHNGDSLPQNQPPLKSTREASFIASINVQDVRDARPDRDNLDKSARPEKTIRVDWWSQKTGQPDEPGMVEIHPTD